MRRVLFCSILAVVLTVAALGEGSPSSAARQAQFRQVNIRVSCDGNEVDEVNIRPWTARASRNASEQLRWRLLPASDVDSVTIRPKSTSEWPFSSTPPLTVSGAGQNAVDSGPITAAAGSYFYDIIVDCGAGPTVIDPRMDIGG